MLTEAHDAIIQAVVNVVIQEDPTTSNQFLDELKDAVEFALTANELADALGETTVDQVSKETGVPLQTVRALFDGSRDVPLSSIQRVARYVVSLLDDPEAEEETD